MFIKFGCDVLFCSLLLRRECCTFSNGEYVKSGLAELEKWIGNATEEVINVYYSRVDIIIFYLNLNGELIF